MSKVKKNIKKGKEPYNVGGKRAKSSEVKNNKTDAGGNFYVYSLYDARGRILALNRYVYKNSEEQPFEELTAEEELILNPVIETPEEEMI